jgi:hypothetical protein
VPDGLPQAVDETRPIANPRRKLGEASIDDVVADMCAPGAKATILDAVFLH